MAGIQIDRLPERHQAPDSGADGGWSTLNGGSMDPGSKVAQREAEVASTRKEIDEIFMRWGKISGQNIPPQTKLFDLGNCAPTPELRVQLTDFLLTELPGKFLNVQASILAALEKYATPFDLSVITELYDKSPDSSLPRNSIARMLDQKHIHDIAKKHPGSEAHVTKWLKDTCSQTSVSCNAFPLLFDALVRFAGKDDALPILRRQFEDYPGIVAGVLRSKRIGGKSEIRMLEGSLDNLAGLPGVARHTTATNQNTENWTRGEIQKAITSLQKRNS